MYAGRFTNAGFGRVFLYCCPLGHGGILGSLGKGVFARNISCLRRRKSKDAEAQERDGAEIFILAASSRKLIVVGKRYRVQTGPCEGMKEKHSGRSPACDETLITDGCALWHGRSPDCRHHESEATTRSHSIYFRSVYFSPWGKPAFAAAPGAAGCPREMRGPKAPGVFVPSALRVVLVVHKGALPITCPAHSQHQLHFGEPS